MRALSPPHLVEEADGAVAGGRWTDGYRFGRVLVAIFLVATIDVTNYLDTGGSGRYLLLFIPFGVVALARMRVVSSFVRRTAAPDRVLFALFLFGLGGALYGRIFLQTKSTAIPAFLPLAIGFLYLLVLRQPTEEEARRLLRAIAWVGLLYVALNAMANVDLLPGLRSARNYRNAQVMYVALGGAATLLIGRRARLAAFVVLAFVVFRTYPSATFTIVAFAAVVTLFVTRPAGSNRRAYAFAVIGTVVAVVAILNFDGAVKLADDYFFAVGKQANSNARIALWTEGVERFERSPLVGDAFSGPTTTMARRVGGSLIEAPYHNDYVLFLASGGIVGLGLLLAWIVLTEVLILRRYRAFLALGQVWRARLLRALLVAFNAWFVAAAFNPLFTGVSRSVTLAALYAMMMCVGRPSAEADRGPGTRVAQRSRALPAEARLEPV